LLRTQLILKGIINEDDWYTVRDILQYDFLQDGHFSELKQTEMLRERLALANEMRDYVGKYFSVEYVRKNILKQNEREIEDMDNQIKKEIDDGIIASPTAQNVDQEI
jgi:bacterioferritin (cytochrome b1)